MTRKGIHPPHKLRVNLDTAKFVEKEFALKERRGLNDKNLKSRKRIFSRISRIFDVICVVTGIKEPVHFADTHMNRQAVYFLTCRCFDGRIGCPVEQNITKDKHKNASQQKNPHQDIWHLFRKIQVYLWMFDFEIDFLHFKYALSVRSASTASPGLV